MSTKGGVGIHCSVERGQSVQRQRPLRWGLTALGGGGQVQSSAKGSTCGQQDVGAHCAPASGPPPGEMQRPAGGGGERTLTSHRASRPPPPALENPFQGTLAAHGMFPSPRPPSLPNSPGWITNGPVFFCCSESRRPPGRESLRTTGCVCLHPPSSTPPQPPARQGGGLTESAGALTGWGCWIDTPR